ncbi:MAG: hypothetical protein UW41_C0015G0001, partial [Candidatus Collierbacteria bacterium GW2011_GWC2_44_18]
VVEQGLHKAEVTGPTPVPATLDSSNKIYEKKNIVWNYSKRKRFTYR